jgi:glutamate-5-semialdehyde dehydrogenase
MNEVSDLKQMAQLAKSLTYEMAAATTQQKNDALNALIENIELHRSDIMEANSEDVAQGKAAGLNDALLERLSLENKLEGIIGDIKQVISLNDPVGEQLEEKVLPNKLNLAKYRTPLGVLGVIYESRPNVTIDISALTIKSGNCAILRGGSETLTTNLVLIGLIQKSLSSAGLPSKAIQLIANSDRMQVKELLQLHEYIDLIIPRGSAALQDFCRKNSTIPVITGGIGICHLFVDESANFEESLKVIYNAKTRRPTVCNALGTLLVHESIARQFIPKVIEFLGNKNVSFRLDSKAWSTIANHPFCKPAESIDWDTEWLSLVLGIKVVDSLEAAISHIHTHSTGHSDGILTEDSKNANIFINNIDSAVVYVNASTCFTDGAQFGLGSEVAISTQKLHARGPMGLKELTSYKWVVRGDYQVRP